MPMLITDAAAASFHDVTLSFRYAAPLRVFADAADASFFLPFFASFCAPRYMIDAAVTADYC